MSGPRPHTYLPTLATLDRPAMRPQLPLPWRVSAAGNAMAPPFRSRSGLEQGRGSLRCARTNPVESASPPQPGPRRTGRAAARRRRLRRKGVRIMVINQEQIEQIAALALLQRLAAVRGRLSLCADQAAAAKWWLSMPMASVSAEGPMPKALSTRRTSPLMPGCRHQGRACPLRRARMTSNPLIVA